MVSWLSTGKSARAAKRSPVPSNATSRSESSFFVSASSSPSAWRCATISTSFPVAASMRTVPARFSTSTVSPGRAGSVFRTSRESEAAAGRERTSAHASAPSERRVIGSSIRRYDDRGPEVPIDPESGPPKTARRLCDTSRMPPPRLDPVVHEPVRLLVLTALAAHGALLFPDLKRLVGTSDGNLGIHVRRLEEAGLVHARKSFLGRVPSTRLRLTAKGRAALRRYATAMRRLLAPV